MKFFRAEHPDELWQLDVKGPVWIGGQKFWFPTCVDDHSRYLLVLECFDHEPTAEELTALLERLRRNPKSILTDNAGQFRGEHWRGWCAEHGIEPLYAHPYYPQDKGKVERTIRNIAEEFVNLSKRFLGWLEKIGEYRRWYNGVRVHLGINTQPSSTPHWSESSSPLPPTGVSALVGDTVFRFEKRRLPSKTPRC